MVLRFEELRVLQAAEKVADGIWRRVVRWEAFARDTVGNQMARAADSIGANVAEAYGRYHYGEKLQFLYYARGSVYETKYWLNRAQARKLVTDADAADYAGQLTELARQLNSYAGDLRKRRHGGQTATKSTRDAAGHYTTNGPEGLFTEADLEQLGITNP